MILDLYARLDRRSWLDLARLPLVLMLAIACFILGANAGHAAGMRFTETTGRAVILDPALEQQARMLALEEAPKKHGSAPLTVPKNRLFKTDFSKNKKKVFFFFRFWLGGAAPQTPRILAGGAKPPQTPP